MKRHFFFLLLAAGLTACASAPQSPKFELPAHGVYIDADADLETQLSEEAALHLARACPPYRCLLEFQQTMPREERFGLRLLSALQRDGYFVRQWHAPGKPLQCVQPPGEREDKNTLRIVAVCYLVDEVLGMTRLSLFAEGDAWNRLFAVDQGQLQPAGAWTRQRAE
jgi:hypothetical protein